VQDTFQKYLEDTRLIKIVWKSILKILR